MLEFTFHFVLNQAASPNSPGPDAVCRRCLAAQSVIKRPRRTAMLPVSVCRGGHGRAFAGAVHGDDWALPPVRCHACLPLPGPTAVLPLRFSDSNLRLSRHNFPLVWALPAPLGVVAPGGLKLSWRSWNSYQKIPTGFGGNSMLRLQNVYSFNNSICPGARGLHLVWVKPTPTASIACASSMQHTSLCLTGRGHLPAHLKGRMPTPCQPGVEILAS